MRELAPSFPPPHSEDARPESSQPSNRTFLKREHSHNLFSLMYTSSRSYKLYIILDTPNYPDFSFNKKKYYTNIHWIFSTLCSSFSEESWVIQSRVWLQRLWVSLIINWSVEPDQAVPPAHPGSEECTDSGSYIQHRPYRNERHFLNQHWKLRILQDPHLEDCASGEQSKLWLKFSTLGDLLLPGSSKELEIECLGSMWCSKTACPLRCSSASIQHRRAPPFVKHQRKCQFCVGTAPCRGSRAMWFENPASENA